MSRDGHTIAGPCGEVRIEPDALSALVVAAAELVDGARVRRPRRGLELSVERGRATVQLGLSARYGAVLPALGRAVQASVAEALHRSASLEVETIGIVIEELDR